MDCEHNTRIEILTIDDYRFVTTQKSIDALKKSSRDARQLAGAYRMSRGGAPSLVSGDHDDYDIMKNLSLSQDIVKGGEA